MRASMSFTVRRAATLVPALLFALLCGEAARPSPAPAQEVCAGDCNGSGKVTVDGLVALVRISGGAFAACNAGIPDGADVDLDLIKEALENALEGCASLPAPDTATPTFTPTAEPSATRTLNVATATPSKPPTPPTPGSGFFCDLPGSVRNTSEGRVIVPGGGPEVDKLTFMNLPVGFCAHYFANVGNVRQLRFAPSGELFVASPSMITTGGGPNGKNSIFYLADDNQDGLSDGSVTYLNNLPATQGMTFANGWFYYQNDKKILRRPYTPGSRVPSETVEQVAEITLYYSLLHWPKPMDVADDGTIYVGNGGDQTESCARTGKEFHGGIFALDGSPGGLPVVKGFRNPISVRCARGHNLCYAVELAKDFSNFDSGREKIAPIRSGGDWGFPCCATKDRPYTTLGPAPDCSGVSDEAASFEIGGTPFDVDFETGKWPAPWKNRAYVPLHGAYGTWAGARVVGIEMDPDTGDMLPGSDLGGPSSGAMSDFATGWDDNSLAHGRPGTVAFSADGRLFLGNDRNGDILWIAPLELPR